MPESYQELSEEEALIGSGKFGMVHRVRRLSDNKVSQSWTIVACKSIGFRGTDNIKKSAERESAILGRLRHDNVIRQLDVRWLPKQVKIYMDYCQHGSLQDLINQTQKSETMLSESYIWHIAFQIAAAIVYCHYGLRWDSSGNLVPDRTTSGPWNAILHRDIKPANVFLASRSQSDLRAVVLGDFGLGQILQESGPPSTYVGTHQYMPPEISRSSGTNIAWTTQCDVFSFGCTLYSLCALGPPFHWHMDSQDQVYDPLPDWYSADLARFISSCLAFHPEMRPDALRLFGQAQYHVVPSQGSLSRSLDLYDASLLTGAGFKIDSPHFDADAALLWSAKERIESITQRLLEKGADVNCKTLKGETPLLLACSSQSEHLNIVRLLLKKGAEINWEDEYGQTPLHRACNLGRVDLARLLLQTGAEVNATDSNLGRVDLARLLLQTGAEVNATDSNGMTPLHHARVPYRLEIAGLLLQRGAEVNAMDMDRETPLSCAIPYHWRTAKLLRQHGAKYEYLERSVLAIDLRNILFEESSASRRS